MTGMFCRENIKVKGKSKLIVENIRHSSDNLRKKIVNYYVMID